MLIAPLLLVILAAGQPTPQAPAADVCALLTDRDIESILGERVQQRTPGARPATPPSMPQCSFITSSARAVSLAIVMPPASSGRPLSAREHWRNQFHPGRAGKVAGEKDAEGEQRPRRIQGVGDEAFWSGTRIAGALYVLKGDTILRVSVGGYPKEAERIEKSKSVAVAALQTLSAAQTTRE